MPKIFILDTYYQAVLDSWGFNASAGYAAELKRLLEFSFGSFDAYSRNLTAIGWECMDAIANSHFLQKLWAKENGFSEQASLQAIALQQIETFQPDVIFCQDLSFFHESTLQHLGGKYTLAGQCSCQMPKEEKVIKFRILFSSFFHYVPRFRALGVKPVYLPPAFDGMVIARTQAVERDIDVSFVGGLGAPSHWLRGMETLEAIAQEIPQAKFWGYGADLLHPSSPILAKHQGQAFGVDMYQILLRSKIVVNRHGEVAAGWANNMRLYEATGCGACLLTEDAPNLGSLFPLGGPVRYRDPAEAVAQIKRLLEDSDSRMESAQLGYLDTLSRHTYRERMAVLASELKAV